MKKLYQIKLLTLATLSGSCGISYELLYTRMLSSYFGSVFYVSAAILISFLIGIGIGSLLAYRGKNYLQYIEILIGLYAVAAAYVFSNHAVAFTGYFLDIQWLLVAAPSILVIVPAVLIGLTMPIFSIYLSEHLDAKDSSLGFRSTYLLYSLGAAIAVLTVEFFLVREYGITVAMLCLAFINLLVGFSVSMLLKQSFNKPLFKLVKDDSKIKINKPLLALFLASISSGIFQLLFLRLSHYIFGPFNENFGIMLIILLIGIALGTFITKKFSLGITKLLFPGVIITLATFSCITLIIYLLGFSYEAVADVYDYPGLIKFFIMFIWGLPGFAFFGALIPALLYERQAGFMKTPGQALAVSASANAAGFILLVSLVHIGVSYLAIVIIIMSLILLAEFILSGKFLFLKAKIIYRVPILIIFTTILFLSWPSNLLWIGYHRFTNFDYTKSSLEKVTSIKHFNEYGDSVQVIDISDGRRLLMHSGYLSLNVGGNSIVSLRETIAGSSAALFQNRRDSAMVLGYGSGITVGATAKLYDTVTVAEINPSMLKAAREFKAYNHDVLDAPNVNIEIQDGIVALLKTKQRYNLIVNTISSPSYFTANKLWTKEALGLIQDRLAPGGIFSGWFDLRIGEVGAISQLKTFHKIFDHCAYFIINHQYYNVLCSDTPLIAVDLPNDLWPQSIRDLFKDEIDVSDISEFILDLQIAAPTDAEGQRLYYNRVPINTLDLPILEFMGGVYEHHSDPSAYQFFIEFNQLPLATHDGAIDLLDKRRRCNHVAQIINNVLVTVGGLPECDGLIDL